MNLNQCYLPGVHRFENKGSAVRTAVGNDVWHYTGGIALQCRAIFTHYLYRDSVGTGRSRLYDDLRAADRQSNLAQGETVVEAFHHIRNFWDCYTDDGYRLIPAVPIQRVGGDLDHC